MTKKRRLAGTQPDIPASKRKKESSSSSTDLHIPDDILFSHILPTLSAKSLCKLQLVCRQWQSVLSNPGFRLRQSLCHSSISSGFVHQRHWNRIGVLPTLGARVGIPKPALDLRGVKALNLHSSAHGLLCLAVYYHTNKRSLYVCNPVTTEGHHIPMPWEMPSIRVGLAFDPSVSADQYKLVAPFEYPGQNPCYVFNVFSSHTGEWTMGEDPTFLGIPQTPDRPFPPLTVVFAGGVLYWQLEDSMICYHPNKEDKPADAVRLPTTEEGSHCGEIGVWEDRLTYTQIDIARDRINVWVMSEKAQWEIRHSMYMLTVIYRSPELLCSYCSIGSWRGSVDIRRKLWDDDLMQPLPYGGGASIYLRMHVDGKNAKEEEDEEMIFRCDVETRKVELFRKSKLNPYITPRSRRWGSDYLPYHNSLVPLPKLFKKII